MDENQGISTGDNSTPEAGEYTEISYESLEEVQGSPDTGDKTGEDTAPAGPEAGDQTLQTTEDPPPTGNDPPEAWAKRIGAERDKITKELTTQFQGREQQVAQQAQNEVFQMLRPLLEVAEYEARRHGLRNGVEWAQKVAEGRSPNYDAQLSAMEEEWGLEPGTLQNVVMNHPDAVAGREARANQAQTQQKQADDARFEREGMLLFRAFPDLDPKDVRPEVYQLRNQHGLTLLEAYMEVNRDKIAEENRVKAEQAAIKAQKKINNGTPGAIGTESASPAKRTAWDLSDDEFHKLQQRVLSGDKIKFS